MVHAMAVSQPPPSAKPLTAAITGLPEIFSDQREDVRNGSTARVDGRLMWAISLISAPL